MENGNFLGKMWRKMRVCVSVDLVVSEGKVREVEEKDEHKSQKSINC